MAFPQGNAIFLRADGAFAPVHTSRHRPLSRGRVRMTAQLLESKLSQFALKLTLPARKKNVALATVFTSI